MVEEGVGSSLRWDGVWVVELIVKVYRRHLKRILRILHDCNAIHVNILKFYQRRCALDQFWAVVSWSCGLCISQYFRYILGHQHLSKVKLTSTTWYAFLPASTLTANRLSQLTQTLGERIHLTSCKLLSQSAAGTATPQALALTLASAANYRAPRWIPLRGSKRYWAPFIKAVQPR